MGRMSSPPGISLGCLSLGVLDDVRDLLFQYRRTPTISPARMQRVVVVVVVFVLELLVDAIGNCTDKREVMRPGNWTSNWTVSVSESWRMRQEMKLIFWSSS